MNFQGLNKVQNPDFYIEQAFKRATAAADQIRDTIKLKNKTVLDKSKIIELKKITTVKDALYDYLDQIVKSFPNLEELPVFYRELVKVTVDYPELKKGLGGLNWGKNKIVDIYRVYEGKIKKCEDIRKINQFRTEFYGRAAGLIKKLRPNFDAVEKARQTMKNFPAIKTKIPTIAIVGFPNVGKTTLLYKLTGSKPEINAYAFTTQNINVSYIKKDGQRALQILDVPGTLDRFEKMNNIEKQAYLAIEHIADKLVYVLDLTEPYPIQSQVRLLKNLKKYGKDILVYLSKTDILEKSQVEEFRKKSKLKIIANLKELEKEIL